MPFVEELQPVPDVMHALTAFQSEPAVLLLESSLKRDAVGRYTFLTADPFEYFELQTAAFGDDPFHNIRRQCEQFTVPTISDLPPFQGGAAGMLSYELGGVWEKLPTAAHDEFQLPRASVGLFDWVIAWDHARSRAWIISHGFPETELSPRADRAERRLVWVKDRLSGRSSKLFSNPACDTPNRASHRETDIAFDRLCRTWPVPGRDGLLSDFSRDGYLRAVGRVIESIHAGDIFQANLSQRLLHPLREPPIELYRRLRQRNPAPFSGYFGCDDWAVVSASPERFVRVRDRQVDTRPIKGTRRRQTVPEADLYTRDELRESAKDQAENVMIVDLLRNDLSRVCAPGSIQVPQLCAVESYETVQHLVSEIRGNLADEYTAWDLMPAVFPGGSITGAPKVRAMEIIAELEPTVRGPYCGSLFYLGFDGTMDSSILIRTFVCRRGWIQCSVGGGIVAQSDPAAEYEETLHKAEGMLRAL